MSLFSALFNVGIARRVGLWALIQALPDEDALRAYLRAAYMGMASVIIGSVLTGSAIAAGIAAAYHMLMDTAGWTQSQALAATAGFTLLLIVACFAIAGHWFVRLTNIKDDYSVNKKTEGLTGFVQHAMQEVAQGFVEGVTNPRAQTPAQGKMSVRTARRIRLIN